MSNTNLVRPIPGSIVDLDDARGIALAHVRSLAPRALPLAGSAGLILAHDVRAGASLPPVDNAAMDGYAVCCQDIAAGAELGTIDAIPISTGAPLPVGTDTVVPLERVRRAGSVLHIEGQWAVGANIRRAGEEIHRGEVALRAGQRLTPAAVGLLAALGRDSVEVVPPPRVAILVSGDELVGPGHQRSGDGTHDANGPMLTALLDAAGAEIVGLVRANDNPEALRAALVELVSIADLVCTSGGTSVGRRDFMVGVASALGTILFRQMNVRPGRPTCLVMADSTPIVLLPGNPLALLVGFEAVARPCVRRLAGDPRPLRNRVVADSTSAIPHRAGRLEMVPVELSFDAKRVGASVTSHRGSAMLRGAAAAHGMAILERERGDVIAGEEMVVEVWSEVQ